MAVFIAGATHASNAWSIQTDFVQIRVFMFPTNGAQTSQEFYQSIPSDLCT